jgi:hypothetical protein
MNPGHVESANDREPRKEQKKASFRIVKLEERIVPMHCHGHGSGYRTAFCTKCYTKP